MYITTCLAGFYDRVPFPSLMAAIAFSRAKAQFARTPIDVHYVGPHGRLRCVYVAPHPLNELPTTIAVGDVW